MPTTSSQQMSYQFSNSNEKELRSSQSPRSAGSHWIVLSHMTTPEPITGAQGMECADWPDLEQEVGPFSLDDWLGGRRGKSGMLLLEQGRVGVECAWQKQMSVHPYTPFPQQPLRTGSSSPATVQGPPPMAPVPIQ